MTAPSAYAGLLAGRGVLVVVHGDLRTTYEPVTALVAVGQAVRAGEPVAVLDPGHEGCPVAACLHWGPRRGDAYLDPVRLVERGPVRLLPLTTGVAPAASTLPDGAERPQPALVGAGAGTAPVVLGHDATGGPVTSSGTDGPVPPYGDTSRAATPSGNDDATSNGDTSRTAAAASGGDPGTLNDDTSPAASPAPGEGSSGAPHGRAVRAARALGQSAGSRSAAPAGRSPAGAAGAAAAVLAAAAWSRRRARASPR